MLYILYTLYMIIIVMYNLYNIYSTGFVSYEYFFATLHAPSSRRTISIEFNVLKVVGLSQGYKVTLLPP